MISQEILWTKKTWHHQKRRSELIQASQRVIMPILQSSSDGFSTYGGSAWTWISQAKVHKDLVCFPDM
jgi:hypothetical protein